MLMNMIRAKRRKKNMVSGKKMVEGNNEGRRNMREKK